MDIREAPKAADTKSRREKDGDFSKVPSVTIFLSSIACSLIIQIEKQNGRRTRTANGSTDGRPCPLSFISSRPAAFDRAL
jgi:hypothetical protein